MRGTRLPKVAFWLGIASLVLWLMSYSWIILAAFEIEGPELTFSPWLVAELLAVGVGLIALVVGIVGQAWATPQQKALRTVGCHHGWSRSPILWPELVATDLRRLPTLCAEARESE